MKHFGKHNVYICGCFIFQNALRVFTLCNALFKDTKKSKEVFTLFGTPGDFEGVWDQA
jgi:hypothetical protein